MGKKAEPMSKGGACPPCVQWTYWPSCGGVEYQGEKKMALRGGAWTAPADAGMARRSGEIHKRPLPGDDGRRSTGIDEGPHARGHSRANGGRDQPEQGNKRNRHSCASAQEHDPEDRPAVVERRDDQADANGDDDRQ